MSLFFFKLFIYSLWISNHVPHCYSSPCPSVSGFCPWALPLKENKNKIKFKKLKFKLKCLTVEPAVYHGLSPTLLFCPNKITNVYCSESFAWFEASWLLLHFKHWNCTRTPLGYPVVAVCHGAPAALCLQGQHLHMFYQFLHGADVGWANLKPWIRVLVVIAELHSACSPITIPTGLSALLRWRAGTALPLSHLQG